MEVHSTNVILLTVVAIGFCSSVAVTGQNNNTSASIPAVFQEAIGGYFDGCYPDDQRSLTSTGNLKETLGGNNNARCVKKCKEAGFSIVATQGADCYCSNSLPVPALFQSDDERSSGKNGPCNIRCPGVFSNVDCKNDECCGGEKAFSVYIVDEIDVINELSNRIIVNFRNDRAKIVDAILTPEEKELLSCGCNSGEVSIVLTATDPINKLPKTIETRIDIANEQSTRNIGNIDGLREVQLVLKSIKKELETRESLVEKPFGRWDLLCTNFDGGAPLSCQKTYSESTTFTKTYSVTSGLTATVTIGISATANIPLFGSVTSSFSASSGRSFTKAYTETTSETKTDSISIGTSALPGTKVEVRFFSSMVPVKTKWRANFFADGDVLVDLGGLLKKKVHLSELLAYEQRKLYAFGVIDHGERPTISGITKMVDKDGKVVRPA